MSVEGNEEIIKHNEKLYAGLLTLYLQTGIPFIPHISIGYFGNENDELNKAFCEKAHKGAEAMHINATTHFDNLTLIKGDGITPAKRVKAFVLR